jgi:hypothetical protein
LRRCRFEADQSKIGGAYKRMGESASGNCGPFSVPLDDELRVFVERTAAREHSR